MNGNMYVCMLCGLIAGAGLHSPIGDVHGLLGWLVAG